MPFLAIPAVCIARYANALLKMQRWKMQEWKMRHKTAGLENARQVSVESKQTLFVLT